MKKLFTSLFMLGVLGMANAATYTGTLQTLAPEDAGIEFGTVTTTVEITDNGDGTYDFTLNNWMYGVYSMNMGLGTVNLAGLNGVTINGVTVIDWEGEAEFVAGTDSSVYYWGGVSLGTLPASLLAKFDATECYAEITMDAADVNGTTYNGIFGEDNFGDLTPDNPGADAQSYTGSLQTIAPPDAGITFDPVTTTVDITDNGDGTYDFTLNNWMYGVYGYNNGLGTITLTGLTGTTTDGITVIEGEGLAEFVAGTDPSIYYWGGVGLGELNTEVYARFDAAAMYATISVDASQTYYNSVYNAVFTCGEISTGVAKVEMPEGDFEVYTLGGMKVSDLSAKGIYIVRYANGVTRKVMVK